MRSTPVTVLSGRWPRLDFKTLISHLRQKATPLLYVGSTGLLTGTQLVMAFITVRYVMPAQMGVWNSVRLAQVYSVFLLAGVLNGLGRELPYFHGKADHGGVDRLAATALFCTDLACLFTLVAGGGCCLFFHASSAELLWAIVAVTALISLTFYRNYLTVLFRSNNAFNQLSLGQLIEATGNLAAIPLVIAFGYRGMLARLVLTSAAVVLMLYRWRPIVVPRAFHASAFRVLLKTGVPFFGLDYLRNCATTVDCVVLLSVAGTLAVGQYALAATSLGIMYGVFGAVNQYIYPRMCFQFGQSGDPRILWRMGLRGSLASLLAGGAVAALAWPLMDPVIRHLAPHYLPGVPAARLAVITGALEGSAIVVSAIWSMKTWRMMVFYQIVNSALLACGPIALLWCVRDPLLAVSAGLLVAGVLRGLLALVCGYVATHPARPPAAGPHPAPQAL